MEPTNTEKLLLFAFVVWTKQASISASVGPIKVNLF